MIIRERPAAEKELELGRVGCLCAIAPCAPPWIMGAGRGQQKTLAHVMLESKTQWPSSVCPQGSNIRDMVVGLLDLAFWISLGLVYIGFEWYPINLVKQYSISTF